MSHLYFAYGSNLEPVQMKRRCPGSAPVGQAVLPDHRLGFPVRSDGDWLGGVASVEPSPGEAVHGVLYRITDEDLAELDLYEAVAEGMYRREMIGVWPVGDPNPQQAWTYIALPDPQGPSPPSRAYLDVILLGARHYGLSPAYIQQLEAIRTADSDSLH